MGRPGFSAPFILSTSDSIYWILIHSIIICSVLRFGFSTFQSAREDRQDANCKGKNDVREVIYSSNKVSSSRDFRFGVNLKNKTILKSLLTTKGNLCIYLISLHGICIATVLQKCKLIFVTTGLFRGRHEYSQLHQERPAMCPAGNQMRRWFGDLKDRLSVGPAQCISYVKKSSVTQLTALAQRKTLGSHRHEFAHAKCCWNPTSKGHALCSECQCHPHWKMHRTICE